MIEEVLTDVLFVFVVVAFCVITWLAFRKVKSNPSTEDDDEAMKIVLSECFRTGRTVMGRIGEDGILEVTICDDTGAE